MENNEAKGKKKANPIIFVIIAVVLLGGAAAIYFLLFANQAPKMADEFYYSPGDSFVTNVEGSTTLIKATMTIGTSRDMTEELTTKNAVLRDGILEIMRRTPADTFKSTDVQKYLSDAICAYFNAMFMPYEKDPSVTLFTKVYITDLVMQ